MILMHCSLLFGSSTIAIVGIAVLSLFLAHLRTQEYCYSNVTTLDPNDIHATPSATCFTVTNSGVFSKVSEASTGKRIENGFVIPGLWDGHGHLLQYGASLRGVDLLGIASFAEIQSTIRKFLLDDPNSGTAEQWIRGFGWDQAAYGGRMPTAKDLDDGDILHGKYIMLDRVDVHCVWVSQAVLDLLPNPLPASPPGGEIVTDPGPGVFCDNAIEIVYQHWPKPGKQLKAEYAKKAMQELNKVGLVGMHDAGVLPQDLHLYQELAEKDDWTLRVYAMMECETRNTFCPEQAVKVERADGMLSVRSVKLFADGALGSWGSALLEPYTDHPSRSGSLLVTPSALINLTDSWASLGYQVNIHAIGDLANRLAIAAQTTALATACKISMNDTTALAACQQQRRFRIEHSQIIHPSDQAYMHAIGILPSIQPTHATSDIAYAEDRLGRWRLDHEAYRMRSFLPLNPVLGSDFPVEPPNPFQGIYAAVTRRSPRTGKDTDNSGEGTQFKNETLTVREALLGFTQGAAYGAFLEGRAGAIRKGAFADWVVLDTPIKDGMDVEDLRSLIVRETWVAGRRVYKREH